MIRITALSLENFKNVGAGRMTLSSYKPGDGSMSADIVGLYGQNGSGKTSTVNAFSLLRTLMIGDSLPKQARDWIGVGKDDLRISIEGACMTDGGDEHLRMFSYTVTISCDEKGPFVRGERMSVKDYADDKPAMKLLFQYDASSDGDLRITPKVAWEAIAHVGRGIMTEILVAQRMSRANGGSLLFSEEFIDVLIGFDNEPEGKEGSPSLSKAAKKAYHTVLLPLLLIVLELANFAMRDLAVITPQRQAYPNLNQLMISTHEGQLPRLADIFIPVDLNEPMVVDRRLLGMLNATVGTISTVSQAIVPGFSVEVADLGAALTPEGEEGRRVELVAVRDGTRIPLRCESEGVKKLVPILVLLVDVYAKPGSCVVIDELDSGVFEYLLGEILQVLQDHGRGQLIFTAHNLRPLETISKNSLVFTTTNPQRRYITFTGSKATNNLRDQYLRALNLGGQVETVYEPTSKFEIERAFYEAGAHLADAEAGF